MSERAMKLADHFEDAEQQREAATLGMWVFLVTEIMFFGGLFAGYSVYRYLYPAAFAAGGHHLDISLGAVNTVVLITSSLTMALAVRSAQLGQRKLLVAFLLLTLLLGATFLGIKAYEYHHKYIEHLVPGPAFYFDSPHARQVELFFGFYFSMTGLHALHMIVGIGLIAVFAVRAWRGHFSPEYDAPVDILGLYWHFVDIVWIFLFPLLYLIGHR